MQNFNYISVHKKISSGGSRRKNVQQTYHQRKEALHSLGQVARKTRSHCICTCYGNSASSWIAWCSSSTTQGVDQQLLNLGEASASTSSAAPGANVPYFIPTATLPLAGPGAIHYPSQDPSRLGATQRQLQQ